MKLFLFISALFLSTASFAQQNTDSSKAGIVKEDFKDDWADLHHYIAENKLLPTPSRHNRRVVFLGSSIFEFWKLRMPEYFENNPQYVDRGIRGQISPQLLIRFRQDVINLKPKAVIILAGSNDISGSTGHITNEVIMDNIKSMVELAKANHIKPILCAYLPIYEYPWRKDLKPANDIIALNKLITAYALKRKLTLIDYFNPLKDGRNGQRPELTTDGVHPNHEGYLIMAKITDEAIAKTVK